MKSHKIPRIACRYVTATVLALLLCTLPAMASEKFVLSATDGYDLVLKIYELNGNQIKTVNSTVADTQDISSFGPFNTAVTFRTINGKPTFDVYYGLCQDLECVDTILGMKRFDSNLNPILENGNLFHSIRFWSYVDLATERVVEPTGLSLRLLFANNGVIAERILQPNGALGAPAAVAFRGQSLKYSASEDGRMVVAAGVDSIQLRPFHPAGALKTLQTQTDPFSLTLSGPIATAAQSLSAGSITQKHRFLFFRAFKASAPGTSNIMIQKIDGATESFIGKPRVLAHFNSDGPYSWLEWYKSVAVSPRADVVFFTQLDSSCGDREILSAQVMDPQKGIKIGPPQVLIGCGEIEFSLSGLDVAEFQH